MLDLVRLCVDHGVDGSLLEDVSRTGRQFLEPANKNGYNLQQYRAKCRGYVREGG